MMRSPVQIWLAGLTLSLAGLVWIFTLGQSTQSAGEGEVSAILHAGYVFIGFAVAGLLALIAVWLWFWHIKWLRWTGFAAFAVAAFFAATML